MDTGSPEEKLPYSPEEKIEYAAHWTFNAETYAKQGCYEWMASFLDPIRPKKILDIGCGVGHGIRALVRRFDSRIVALDENAPALTEAETRLADAGIASDLVCRFFYEDQSGGTHVFEPDHNPICTHENVSLIQADILVADKELEEYLSVQAPFDAVTCWLTGTDPNRRMACRNLAPLQISSAGDYRLRVQNRVYVLASHMLRSGGLLHIVDRGEVPSTAQLVEDTLRSHREQAGPTDLRVVNHDFRKYEEDTSGMGIGMVVTPGTSGRQAEPKKLAMISVIAAKP